MIAFETCNYIPIIDKYIDYYVGKKLKSGKAEEAKKEKEAVVPVNYYATKAKDALSDALADNKIARIISVQEKKAATRRRGVEGEEEQKIEIN